MGRDTIQDVIDGTGRNELYAFETKCAVCGAPDPTIGDGLIRDDWRCKICGKDIPETLFAWRSKGDFVQLTFF